VAAVGLALLVLLRGGLVDLTVSALQFHLVLDATGD